MDILGQSALIASVTGFTLGVSVLARNPRNQLYRSYLGVTWLVALWAGAFYMDKVWPGGIFYRFHLLLNVWIGPATLILIRWLVRVDPPWLRRLNRRLLETAVVASVVLSLSLALEWDQLPQLGQWVRQAVLFAPTFGIAQILILMVTDRKSHPSGVERSRRVVGPVAPGAGPILQARSRLIYLGAIAVFSLSVMDHVPFLGKVLPAIGNLALSVYLYFISQAITQQRLLNLGALISRFVVLLAVALFLTLIYLSLVAWIQDSPALFFLNSFIASFVVLSLLNPLQTLLREFSDRLLTQKHRKLQLLLKEARQRLVGVLEPSGLYAEILATVDQVLEPEWAALFVLRSDGTQFRRVGTIGKPDPQANGALPRELIADHPLLQYCVRQRRRGELAILFDAMLETESQRISKQSLRVGLEGLREGLRTLGGNLLLPMVDEQSRESSDELQLLGFVIVDVPTPPEAWGGNWGLLSLVAPFYESLGQNLRSLEVFTRSREKERLAELGEMSAGLAHEIRNPLGAIKGAAQFLDPSIDRPESRFLRVILEEVDRLNRVVTQFLDYSKPHAIEFKRISLTELIQKTLDFQRPGIDPSVELEYVGPTQLPEVLGSSEQLHQVLINLIQNSLKALREGARPERPKIRVEVEVERLARRKEVRIIIEDNGHGIRKENLEKIFIPFFTTSPSGTGLGLSICQKIIEAHHGRIEVLSEEGRGTRVLITLPQAPQAG